MKEIDPILLVEWKATPCSVEDCWCAIIEPVTKIVSERGFESYIAGSGCIPKDYAEHIVALHNQYIRSLNTNGS